MKILITNKTKKRILSRKHLTALAKKILTILKRGRIFYRIPPGPPFPKGRKHCELSILLVNDPYIRKLNKKFRKKDKPTDVLAFPMDENILGDIVISLDTLRKNAKHYNVTTAQELTRLVIHGILHLIGYTDYTKKDKKKMFNIQEKILKEISK